MKISEDAAYYAERALAELDVIDQELADCQHAATMARAAIRVLTGTGHNAETETFAFNELKDARETFYNNTDGYWHRLVISKGIEDLHNFFDEVKRERESGDVSNV
jgi:hypothetical protein